jgi:hypothetical protein
MSRSIRATIVMTEDAPRIAIKWRLHSPGSGEFPAMRLTVTLKAAAELHEALGEALAEYKRDARTRAKGRNDGQT